MQHFKIDFWRDKLTSSIWIGFLADSVWTSLACGRIQWLHFLYARSSFAFFLFNPVDASRLWRQCVYQEQKVDLARGQCESRRRADRARASRALVAALPVTEKKVRLRRRPWVPRVTGGRFERASCSCPSCWGGCRRRLSLVGGDHSGRYLLMWWVGICWDNTALEP